MTPRAVFDTNIVLSALLFAGGHLAWLRNHWRKRECTPLVSQATVAELIRVLTYPKFQLSQHDRLELLGDYLPYCETVEVVQACSQVCRNPHDQKFLDLAETGNADVLVTGDQDLLVLTKGTRFRIESPQSYRSWLTRT